MRSGGPASLACPLSSQSLRGVNEEAMQKKMVHTKARRGGEGTKIMRALRALSSFFVSSCESLWAFGWRGVRIDCRLSVHPLDQFVELDRLLGRGQCVGLRKSVLTGGLSSPAGGSG